MSLFNKNQSEGEKRKILDCETGLMHQKKEEKKTQLRLCQTLASDNALALNTAT